MSKSIVHNKTEFIENIAEILGILEEKSLSKEWIIGELKKEKIKAHVTENSFQILKEVGPKVVQKILSTLREDLSIRDVKTLTKSLHWFFIDIVASSDPNLTVKSQARKIYALNELIKKTETFRKENLEFLVMLPTGDGMAIGFEDSPEKPLRLSIELHKKLKNFNSTQKEKDRLFIRIGMDTGPVYFMKGIKGEIFWGPGLIIAKRVMDLCGPNQIFASERIARDLKTLSEENKSIMHPIGEYEIKHGKMGIFNIYGKDFGNKINPKKGKIINKIQDDFKLPDFDFKSVEIHLEILKTESMLTRHTWIWEVKNTSNHPLSEIFYSIGGDVPKDISELNLQISDEKNNKLEIISVDKNHPLIKDFHVKLASPIRKNQSGRWVKLEYDWEEPERVFEYSFSSKSKKLMYSFTAPKQLALSHRVLEIVRGLGIKKRANPPPKMDFSGESTKITWETAKNHKILAHDTFEFQW